ncbi:uncharacterized protein LJ206_017671 [Theristicus caerulescens]
MPQIQSGKKGWGRFTPRRGSGPSCTHTSLSALPTRDGLRGTLPVPGGSGEPRHGRGAPPGGEEPGEAAGPGRWAAAPTARLPARLRRGRPGSRNRRGPAPGPAAAAGRPRAALPGPQRRPNRRHLPPRRGSGAAAGPRRAAQPRARPGAAPGSAAQPRGRSPLPARPRRGPRGSGPRPAQAGRRRPPAPARPGPAQLGPARRTKSPVPPPLTGGRRRAAGAAAAGTSHAGNHGKQPGRETSGTPKLHLRVISAIYPDPERYAYYVKLVRVGIIATGNRDGSGTTHPNMQRPTGAGCSTLREEGVLLGCIRLTCLVSAVSA